MTTLQQPFESGSIVSPMIGLARAFELCPVFQLLAPDHATNRRIFYNVRGRPEFSESEKIERPIFLIMPDQPSGSQKVVNSASGWLTNNGTLSVVIEVDRDFLKEKYPSFTTDDEGLLRVWDNLIDELTNQIIDAAYGRLGQNDCQLDISRIYEITLGRNSDAEAATEIGPTCVAMFKVAWGPNQ